VKFDCLVADVYLSGENRKYYLKNACSVGATVMSGNEFHGNKPERKDEDYEKTVLNFLNKEMAHLQPVDSSEIQSEELDFIVSDLLKQVITESDAQQENPQFYPEDPLAEFPDTQNENASEKGSLSTPLEPKASKAAELHKPAVEAPAALFASTIPHAAKKQIPVKAIAIVCALAAIGTIAYFFMGRKSSSFKETRDMSAPVAAPAPIVPERANAVQPPARVADQSKNQKVLPSAASSLPIEKASPDRVVLKETAGVSASKGNAGSIPVKKEEAVPVNASPAAVSSATAKPALTSSTTIVIEGRESASTSSIIERSSAQPQPALLEPMKETPVFELLPISNGSAPKDLIPAELISRTKAAYPEIALRTRSSGTVVLEVHIDNTGKVIKASPVSGPAIFHAEAVKTVMKWRYKPASLNGVNVASKNRAEIVFNLK
jgi:TonB family protein